METGPKRNQTQRNKRRERRAHQLLQQEKQSIESGDDELDESPPRSSKDRGRSKPPRRRRNSSNSFEEDIIDGFAIFSFMSLADLENAVKNSMNLKALEKSESRPNSPHRERLKSNLRKREKKVATHSSSGGGYWCDSESGDDRASDASSDTGIFGAARSLTRECLISTSTPSIPCNSTITSLTTISTATSGGITTTTATATSSASLTTTVTSITSTTPSTTTTPSNLNHPWPPVSQITHPHQNSQSPPHLRVPSPPKRETTPHQKQVLSASPKPIPHLHSNPHSHSHPHTHTHSHPHSHTNSFSNTHSQPLSHSRSHSNSQLNPQLNPHSYSNSQSNPHTNSQSHPHTNSQSRAHTNLQSRAHTNLQSRSHSQHPVHISQQSQIKSQIPHNHPYQNSLSSNPSPHSLSHPLTPSPIPQLKPQNSTSHPSVHSSSQPPPLSSLSSSFGSSSTSLNSSASRDITKQTPPPSRTPRREDSRERDYSVPPIAFTKPAPRASSTPPSRLYSPHLRISPSPGIPLNIHSTQNQAPGFSALNPFNLYHPAGPHTSHTPHGMFAAPLPPGPPGGPLSSNPLPGANSLSAHIPGTPDLLREELNRRFLQAAQDRGTPIVGPTHLLHQHQHMHQHQHTHQHTYHGFAAPFSGGTLVPTPTPHLVPNISGYPGMSPLLPPSGPSSALSSGIPGAFQPKKSGKWCAVHVRIAWEIYHHQQKQQAQKSAEGKPMDTLQSHLFALGNLHRPAELGGPGASMLLTGGSPRLLLDACLPSLQSVALGVSPFPRPSPYAVGAQIGIGGIVSGSGLFNSGRDMPTVPGITPPHEWNRLHRTPSSFPTPPGHPKTDDREKEIEREREKEREREREREKERERELVLVAEKRREEEKERERRNAERIGFDERNRFLNREIHTNSHSRSRSRSRSPIRNGRIDSMIYDKRFEDKSAQLKIKEERREEEFINAEREKMMRNEYLLGQMGPVNPLNMSMFDRTRMIGPPSLLGAERVPPHPSLWNQVDKNSLDIARHNLQLRQEMERESRERLLNSGLHPSLSASFLDQVRFKDEMMYDPEHRYFDRLSFMERERLAYEQSKMPQLRATEQLSMNHFQRTMSPMFNHHMMGKGPSPAMMPGVPPPLIPSASATQSRSHTNSPSSGKSKGCSPSDSNNDLKDKRDSASNSTDPSR